MKKKRHGGEGELELEEDDDEEEDRDGDRFLRVKMPCKSTSRRQILLSFETCPIARKLVP
jgi:hypothetical protein